MIGASVAKAPAPAIALTAASDLNDELTIIQTVLEMALRNDEIDQEDLLEARAAAQRASWTVGHMMNWANRQGAKPVATTLDRLLS
jgi:hypothetical protein